MFAIFYWNSDSDFFFNKQLNENGNPRCQESSVSFRPLGLICVQLHQLFDYIMTSVPIIKVYVLSNFWRENSRQY